MADNIRQNPDKRDQFKCSECRRKKIKCKPPNRQWETAHQKCENCNKHDNTPCGPSYKKSDDPAFSGSRNEVTTHEHGSIRDTEDQPRAPMLQPAGILYSTAYLGGHNGDQPSLVTEEPNGPRKRKFASDNDAEELPDEAFCLLAKLNSFGRSYVFASQLTPVKCRDPGNPIKYNKEPDNKIKAIRDEFHSLFMDICQVGLQLHERGMDSEAGNVFLKLVSALGKYPGLGDDRKNGALWRIAQFFLDMGDQDEHEEVLTKAAETHDASMHQKDPCPPLVNSLIETSRRADRDLLKLWERVYMVAGETSLAIPPIQRSAQHNNANVASILLAFKSIEHSPPALFNQESLHIAAIRGHKQNLTNLLRAGAQVDAPDLHNHTPLFLAAAKGHEECCAELIRYGAKVNSRDRHGTTILEVAAGAGHFRVVQQLVDAGADINPELICCTSSPLQAAIENRESPLEVTLYLMGKGGDVSIRRKDGKNAIDLAEERCAFWAEIIRQKDLQSRQGYFHPHQAYSFDQRHLDFGPGLP